MTRSYLSGHADREHDRGAEHDPPEVALHPPPHPGRVARQTYGRHTQAKNWTFEIKSGIAFEMIAVHRICMVKGDFRRETSWQNECMGCISV